MPLLLNLADVVVDWFIVWWVKSLSMVLFVLYVVYVGVFKYRRDQFCLWTYIGECGPFYFVLLG